MLAATEEEGAEGSSEDEEYKALMKPIWSSGDVALTFGVIWNQAKIAEGHMQNKKAMVAESFVRGLGMDKCFAIDGGVVKFLPHLPSEAELPDALRHPATEAAKEAWGQHAAFLLSMECDQGVDVFATDLQSVCGSADSATLCRSL